MCSARLTMFRVKYYVCSEISGFRELHDSLFQTKQDEIIAAAQMFPGQIIIESQFQIDGLAAELTYIRERLE